MTYKYYHNPRCSKSRQGLELLKENGVEPTIIEYLKVGLNEKEVESILKAISNSPLEGSIRVKEATFKELALKGQDLSIKEWSKVISENPILLERPILIKGKKAVIGRPPENLLTII